MDKLKIEIMEYNYWEHFKFLKDISLILPIDHPKRVLLEKNINEILSELQELKKENNNVE